MANYPLRGNIVRISYNTDDPSTWAALEKFFDIMHEQASAVSTFHNGQMRQVPHVFYWRGAVITHGDKERDEQRLEIQKDGSIEDLNELLVQLESELGTKLFNRRTIRKE